MIDKFQNAAEAVGATVKRFVSIADAAAYLKDLAGDDPVSTSSLPQEIAKAIAPVASVTTEHADARLCISSAMAGIAATGSVVLDLEDPQDRGATALPLIHAVFLRASTVVPDLYDLHGLIARSLTSGKAAYLSITTGPSRTADIERVLTIGVHGPKELHVLVLEGE